MNCRLNSGVCVMSGATHEAFTVDYFSFCFLSWLWLWFLASHIWLFTRPCRSLLSLDSWVTRYRSSFLCLTVFRTLRSWSCSWFLRLFNFFLFSRCLFNFYNLLWFYWCLKFYNDLFLFYDFLRHLFCWFRSYSLFDDVYLNVLIIFCHMNL